MNLKQLADIVTALSYTQLPDALDLSVNLSFRIRFMALASATRRCETSAALTDTGAELDFSGVAVNEESHAPVDLSDIAPQARFVGTFHTHPESATSTRITAQSVRDFAPNIHRHDRRPAAIVDNAAGQTVGPLAYSTADVMTMVDLDGKPGREYFSFLFCLPRTLYLLVWANDSGGDQNAIYQDLLGEAFEEIFSDVLTSAFGLGDDDEFDLDLDAWGDMLKPQCVPLTAILKVAKKYRIGVYAANVSLEGISAETFKSQLLRDKLAVHTPIKLNRFKS